MKVSIQLLGEQPMSASAPILRSHRALLTGTVVITLAALALRLFRLANQSFWIDEISSVLIAQTPLGSIYERSAVGSNSLPTYFIFLKAFIGNSAADLEFRSRLLSVIAGTLSVPLFIAIVYLWRRQRTTALLAGTLLAVNPLHLWYSQEVRGYSVTLFFGLIALLAFELARDRRRARWWALYMVAGLTAVTAHKTALIFLAACGLWHVWDVLKHRKDFKSLMIHVPIALITAIVLTLKSFPPLEGYGRSTTGLEVGYTFLTFLGGYSFGPSLTDIQSFGPWIALSKHTVETGILLVILFALFIPIAANIRQLIARKELQLLLLSIGIVSLYALLTPFPYNIRYVLPGLLGFLALAAVLAVDSKKAFWARLSVGCVLVVSLWADGQWYYSRQYRKADSRAVAQWLADKKENVHSWTVLPDYMKVPIEWYLRPYPDILARAIPPTSDRTTTFPPVPDVLILSRRHHLSQPDQTLASYESATGGAKTNLTFAGFELYVANARIQDPMTEGKQPAQ
jgi:hypothetical protein